MKKNASKIKSHYINFFLSMLVFAFLQISTTLQELNSDWQEVDEKCFFLLVSSFEK